VTRTASDTTLRHLLEPLAAARGKLAGPASLAVVERTIVRGEMPPLHVHDEPEGFHVLEGRLVLVLGGVTMRLDAGHSVVAPAGLAHTYRTESESTRFLAVSFVPSIDLYERFLRAAASPAPADLRAPHESDLVVAALARENGITVLGPPGALPDPAFAA
jgi:quercetin dioxygenase-like cupin family protein